MRIHVIVGLVLYVVCSQATFSGELLDSILQLNAIEKGDVPFKQDDYLAKSDHAIGAWNAATQDERIQFATKMFLVHFRRAGILAKAGDFEAAAGELAEEARLQKTNHGRIEFSTKSPDSFFEDLVELQALVTDEMGSDPLASEVDYHFRKEGDGYVAARLELGDDVRGFAVPDLGKGEALAFVDHLARNGDEFVSSSKWLVVPKGALPNVLKQATREITFDANGLMVVSVVGETPPTPEKREDKNSAVHPDHNPHAVPSKGGPEVKLEGDDTSVPPSPLVVVATVVVVLAALMLLLKRKS